MGANQENLTEIHHAIHHQKGNWTSYQNLEFGWDCCTCSAVIVIWDMQGFVLKRAFIIRTNSALFCLDANNSWTRASISTKFEIMIACSITFLMMYGMIHFCWALFVCANDFHLSSIARTAMHNGADNPARCFRVYTMTTAKRVRWFQPDFRF